MPRYKVVDCGQETYSVMDTKKKLVYPFGSRKDAEGAARDFNSRGFAGLYLCCSLRHRLESCAACPLLKSKKKEAAKMARTKKKKSGCK